MKTWLTIPRTALGRVWPNCTVKRNKTGASSVSRAAAQYLGLSEDDHIVWRIKFSLSEKIIGTMQEVDHGYKFPLRLFTETGEVLLSSQAELVKYICSPECSGLYNIPRVELSALASLIGAQVHVLRPRAGGVGLLNLNHPWDWTTYDPISPQSVDPYGRFYRGSEMYLITEDEVHFFRLSSLDATLPREGAPDVDGTDEAIINEAQEQVEIERFDMVPIATFAKRAEDTDVFVQEPGTNIPVPTELRRSNRKSSRTERYNSYHETREKSKNSKRHKRAVNDYEKVVSEAIVEEPIEDTGVDKATDLDHENPDKSLENETNFLKEKLLAREREETKLRNTKTFHFHIIRFCLTYKNQRSHEFETSMRSSTVIALT